MIAAGPAGVFAVTRVDHRQPFAGLPIGVVGAVAEGQDPQQVFIVAEGLLGPPTGQMMGKGPFQPDMRGIRCAQADAEGDDRDRSRARISWS